MKKILVTGGAGFIGSHLCKRLLDDGNEVVCLDNLFTGTLDNIAGLTEHPRFTFVNHDIILPYYPEEIDEIYNLACPASPIHYKYDAIKTAKVCFLGALNTLGMAKRLHAKILQASTSEVYGDPAVHPQTEDYFGNVNPIGVRSCYDEGKRAAESLFFDYHRKYGLAIRVVRIFNTYGPNMCLDDGRVVSNFIVQALQGRDITVNGDGTQTRSFCYVSDLVDGMIRCMNGSVTGPVNIGNPVEISMRALAEKVIALCGSGSAVVYQPNTPDDPMRRKPSIDYIGQLYGWKPSVSLDDGLKKTIAYFEERLHKEGVTCLKRR